ncbi:MAG: efflux transporter outer membrane subunit [Nitrospirales bacterium]|nr:efflux transporter outer membrane subunit [Nitrospirales bacterium]
MRELRNLWFSSAMWLSVWIMGTGCMVGDPYQKPVIDLPQVWHDAEMVQDGDSTPTITTMLPEAEWWEAFHNEELSWLIRVALRRNHDLREAALRVMEGRTLVMAAGTGLYPQVNVNGAYTRVRRSETILVNPTNGNPESFAPPGADFDIWNAVVDLRWELDLWGRIRRGMEAASAEWDGLEQDRRALMLALISDVGHAYFELRAYDEHLDIARNDLAIQRNLLSLVQNQVSAGLASDLEVSRRSMLVAKSAAEIPNLQRLRANTYHRLEVLTGLAPQTLALAVRPLRDTVIQPEIPIGLPSALLERRPDILSVEQRLIVANARIGQARAFFFPSFSITGSGGFQSSEFSQWLDFGSRTLNIGPSVTLPIFLGKTNVSRLELAETRYEQMLERYHQTILEAFQEVADLLVAIQTRSQQLSNHQNLVKAARKARTFVTIRFKEGLIPFLDVLEAERDVLAAERQIVQIERARLSDMVALFKAVGGGWMIQADS